MFISFFVFCFLFFVFVCFLFFYQSETFRLFITTLSLPSDWYFLTMIADPAGITGSTAVVDAVVARQELPVLKYTAVGDLLIPEPVVE